MAAKTKSKTIWLGLLLGTGLCLLCGLIAGGFMLYRWWDSGVSAGPVVALALRLDGAAGLYLLAGDPQVDSFWLPGGSYYIEAFDARRRLYPPFKTVVPARLNGGEALTWRLQSTRLPQDEARQRQLATLADFLVAVDYGKLKFFETVSGGYRAPFVGAEAEIPAQAVDEFFAGYNRLLGGQAEVVLALEAFESRARAMASDGAAGNDFLARLPPAAPAAQGPLGIVAETLRLFGYLGQAGNRAGEKISDTFEQMPEGARWAAFEQIPPGLLKGAESPEAMLFKLRRGELWDTAAQIHNALLHDPDSPYYQILQDQSKTGRPLLEFVYEEGSEYVKRGMQYNIDIVKFTLKNAFDDIGRGLDYADQVDKWTQFAYDFYYDDPIKATAGLTYGEIKDGITDRIKLDIEEVFGEVLTEDDIEYIAEQLTEELMDSTAELAPAAIATRLAQLTAAVAQAGTDEAEPTATPPPATLPATKALDQAEPVGPTDVMPTKAAPTKTAVTTGTPTQPAAPDWIAEIVAAISSQLVDEGYDPFEIVQFTSDLQICLISAAEDGLEAEAALALCAEQLSSYTDPEGDFVIEPYSITGSSASCESVVYFPNEPAEPILLLLAAHGKFVVVEAGPDTTRWEWQPTGDTGSGIIQGTAEIVGQELKISALVVIPPPAQGQAPWLFQATGPLLMGAGLPLAVILTRSIPPRRRRNALLVISFLSLLLTAQSCVFWGSASGEYTFPLSETGFEFLDIPSTNPNLASLPGSSGQVVIDLTSVDEDGNQQTCVSRTNIRGTGVLKRDGIFTPEDINFTD